MRIFIFVMIALLGLLIADAGAYIDDVGAKVTIVEVTEGYYSNDIEAVTIPVTRRVEAVWLEFNDPSEYGGPAGNVRLYLKDQGANRWGRRLHGLSANSESVMWINAYDGVDDISRLLACTQVTLKRLICRGGPQP